MRKKSNSKLKYIGYALCALLIAIGMWYSCESAEINKDIFRRYNPAASPTDSLMMVRMPDCAFDQPIDYPGFALSFNSRYKQPNWVAWELTRDEVLASGVSREDANFAPDLDVDDCPTLADYKNSGFDRGHMCPAGDMKWHQEAMKACFLLTNMSPQRHELNNGAWKSLEEKCREWAQRDSAIIIICGPVLTDRITDYIGNSRVGVPERYFKVVLAPYAQPVRAIGFIMPNGRVKGGMQAAAVSVDEVEAITGFDFFACLPDDVENKIEAECNFPLWSKKK